MINEVDFSIEYFYKMSEKKTWLKRIGIAGFLFFLIKGLLWLAFLYGGFKFFD